MNAAFLIIDIQKNQKDMDSQSWAFLSKHICALRDVFAALHLPIIHVASVRPEGNEETPPLKTIGKLCDIDETLRKKIAPTNISAYTTWSPAFDYPIPEQDFVAVKRTKSARTPDIENFLRAQKVTTVIMAGVYEGPFGCHYGACVSVSALDFARVGFSPIIVADGTNILVGINHYRQKERKAENKAQGIEVLPAKEIVRKITGRSRKFHFWKEAFSLRPPQ